MSKLPAISAAYPKLVKVIRRQMQHGIIEAQRAVERQKVITYRAIGEYIHYYVDHHVARGEITRFYARLSKDLNISSRTLQHCEQFFRYFPNLNSKDDLSWSHYRYLLRLDSARQRDRWVKRIQAKNLSTIDVRLALSMLTAGSMVRGNGQKLKAPVRGETYTYRLIPAGKQAGEKYPWYVDCGFKGLQEAPLSQAKSHNKYLYTCVKTKQGYRLRVTDSKVEKLFTFKAKLLRVIDGDTLYVIIDQGFGRRVKERLRLKGIDAPELKTFAGRKAKYWVESQLKGLPFIIVKTYRADKYDRYLADIFYLPKEKDMHRVAAQGTCLNSHIVEAGMATIWR